ncbi:hypothetical protein INQ23_23895, partial [Escherichia coli]|nr:hypothetical protein [Escherichia coli]
GSQATEGAALRFDVGGRLIVDGGVFSQGPAVLLADTASLDVRIGRSGTLSGGNALRQDDDAGNYLSLDNNGLVRGTDGPAVRARASVLDLQNRRGGRIEGGVDVREAYGSNAGTIEAGDASAIRATYVDLDNSGTIANNSAAEATIAISGQGDIRNTGLIEARGAA